MVKYKILKIYPLDEWKLVWYNSLMKARIFIDFNDTIDDIINPYNDKSGTRFFNGLSTFCQLFSEVEIVIISFADANKERNDISDEMLEILYKIKSKSLRENFKYLIQKDTIKYITFKEENSNPVLSDLKKLSNLNGEYSKKEVVENFIKNYKKDFDTYVFIGDDCQKDLPMLYCNVGKADKYFIYVSRKKLQTTDGVYKISLKEPITNCSNDINFCGDDLKILHVPTKNSFGTGTGLLALASYLKNGKNTQNTDDREKY